MVTSVYSSVVMLLAAEVMVETTRDGASGSLTTTWRMVFRVVPLTVAVISFVCDISLTLTKAVYVPSWLSVTGMVTREGTPETNAPLRWVVSPLSMTTTLWQSHNKFSPASLGVIVTEIKSPATTEGLVG